MNYIVKCAWCGKTTGKCLIENSHSICKECRDRELNKILVDEVILLYHQGVSVEDTAKRLNVSESFVLNIYQDLMFRRKV